VPLRARKNTPVRRSFFFSFSLRTQLLRDAEILAHRLTALSDAVFANATETTMALAPHIAETLLISLARFEIEAFERARALADTRSPDVAEIDLRREEALQATLRQALFLGDREVARAPLAHVAERLGIALDEADRDWKALAYEATKVLLDVSEERHRRSRGLYDWPTPVFRRAIGAAGATQVPHQQPVPSMTTPAGFALAQQSGPAALDTLVVSTPAPAAAFASSVPEPHDHTVPAAAPQVAVPDAGTGDRIVVPAGLTLPPGLDAATAQMARIAAKPPIIKVDTSLLSEASRAAIAKPRGIELAEAIELYFEVRGLGYQAPFNVAQKREVASGKNWTKENQSNRRLATSFWPEMIGNGPVEEIETFAVDDAVEKLWDVPRDHNRSEALSSRDGYADLIERVEEMRAATAREIEAARKRGASSEEQDRIRLKRHIRTLKVDTFLKHGRLLGAVGRMLADMQLIDHNPFEICAWSKQTADDLKKREEGRARVAWDDRFKMLTASEIYTETLEDPGEPLFWAPLIARLDGLRMEECLQLGPDDFGYEGGIAYLQVRNIIINGVKTVAGERRLPVHPQLLELGLMQLVELRRRQGRIRLFPDVARGQAKGTLSETFSKRFGYYRRSRDIYWPGLDFHALRTTFHNDLLSDDGSDAIRRRLMGHAPVDEGEKSYAQSLKMGPLLCLTSAPIGQI
jgi:integrase